ncbi:MAG TPA: VOC family protein [Chthonomonadaceae bacterium]|nr:VOC family protein [Chthonomonadaceae bacterium]
METDNLVSLDGLTLHVQDVERSVQFYSRIPGAVLVHHRPGQFALFQFGKGCLGLLQVGGGFHAELETADLDAMYAQLRAAGIEPESPPAKRPWGETDFLVKDPDGNLLEFQAH